MNRIRRTLAQVLNRSVAWALFWTLLITTVGIFINVIGIYVIGDVGNWSRWLNAHGSYFLVWRSALYVASVYGWLRIRPRLIRRESGQKAARRFLHAELAAVFAVLALEAATAVQSR